MDVARDCTMYTVFCRFQAYGVGQKYITFLAADSTSANLNHAAGPSRTDKSGYAAHDAARHLQ